MNIRLRLTLWYTTILFLILIIFGVVVYVGLSRSLLVTIDQHLQREAAQVIGEIKFETADHDDEDEASEEDDDGGREETSRQFGPVRVELEYIPEEGVLWRILDRNGQIIIDPGLLAGAPLETATGNGPSFQSEVLADGTPIRLYTVPFVIEQRGAGLIQVAESTQNIQNVQRQLALLLTISIPFVLVIASAGGWFLAANALAPIDRITKAADQISAQELHQRLNLDLPDDEVGRLAATFDKMLARLDDAFERQKQFIADASHEMRTPLTILKGDVDVALNRPRSPEAYRETLILVNQTTDRLTNLVEELLLLARADNNQYPLQVEPVDLANLLAKEVDQLQPRAAEKNIELNLDVPDSILVKADPGKLARLFMNLIDNAIKYSDDGNHISVLATTQGHEVQIDIADTGPGISPEHLPHLFDRFYRVDKARARQLSSLNNHGGAGLGLSIAQWLAQLHGGRIEVTSQVGQGTTFSVFLPR